MTVEIKKAKLTKALFDQIQFLDKADILGEEFYPVGWCIVKSKTRLNLKYIVLNDSVSGELRKMLMYSFIALYERHMELKNVYNNLDNQKLGWELGDNSFSPEKLAHLYGLLQKIKRVAGEKGQFYL